MTRLPDRFYRKTWIFTAQCWFFGTFTLFGLILGPLYWVGAIESADGRPTTSAGIGLTVVASVFMLPAFLLALSNRRARRWPLISLYREGLQAREIGRTSLDQIPLVPGPLRFAWSFLSGQGFRVRCYRVGWESLDGVKVFGPPITRTMTIHGRFAPASDDFPESPGEAIPQIGFHQAEFKTPLDQVAETIREYQHDAGTRVNLPAWPNPSMIDEHLSSS
jgi:hypothetical protein